MPSSTTLKLIQDSPADYGCHTGALVVGDPDVLVQSAVQGKQDEVFQVSLCTK